jgi:CHAT domain-containing protein
MIEFYKQLKLAESKPNSESKAKALRQAQLSLIRDNEYIHPSYWAPFIVVGDWR